MKRIHRIHKDILEENINLIEDFGWHYFNMHSPKDVLYVDKLNFIDCSGYTVINGVYKFYNHKTMLKFMHNYGITCGCERRTINNKVKFFYNNKEMTEQQYNFIRKRADSLGYNNNKGCECGKNQG